MPRQFPEGLYGWVGLAGTAAGDQLEAAGPRVGQRRGGDIGACQKMQCRRPDEADAEPGLDQPYEGRKAFGANARSKLSAEFSRGFR